MNVEERLAQQINEAFVAVNNRIDELIQRVAELEKELKR